MTVATSVRKWIRKRLRTGPRFRQITDELRQLKSASPEALGAYQDLALQKMVDFCYRKVPYYQDLFRELNLHPEDIQTRTDLRKLPLLDKPVVRQNFDKLQAQRLTRPLFKKAHTSGTSGTPAIFMRDYHSINLESAVVWDYWQSAGDTGKRRLTLRGELLVPPTQKGPPYWKYNPSEQELLISSYHLCPQTAPDYLKRILDFRPQILYCYPSTGYLLAKIFREQKVNYQFEKVFTSSESLEEHVRQAIEDTFQTRIFDWYGQTERVAGFCQCEAGNYHVQEYYSLVELLPEDNGLAVVGTHLHNWAMPLLRYHTQDTVVPLPADAPDCACQSPFRAIRKINGRTMGYLVTKEGVQIGNAHSFILQNIPNVLEAQFYQEKAGEVVINVVTNGFFSAENRQQLIAKTRAYTSQSMAVNVLELPSIPRGPNGKFLTIISRLN